MTCQLNNNFTQWHPGTEMQSNMKSIRDIIKSQNNNLLFELTELEFAVDAGDASQTLFNLEKKTYFF